MKLVVFIFSIYLMALSAVPCSDTFNTAQTAKSEVNISLADTHKSSHSDLCSPFCICNCCNMSADFKFSHVIIKETDHNSNFSETFTVRKISIISNYNGSIWQPPKIIA